MSIPKLKMFSSLILVIGLLLFQRLLRLRKIQLPAVARAP